MDVDSEIEVVYSGESDSRPTRSRTQGPTVKLWMQEQRIVCLVAASIRLCAMICSTHPKRLWIFREDELNALSFIYASVKPDDVGHRTKADDSTRNHF